MLHIGWFFRGWQSQVVLLYSTQHHWAISIFRQMSTSFQPKLTAQQIEKTRAKFKQFRILVIGRANAGKTTILRRVCDTTDDPMIFDPSGKKVRYSGASSCPILTSMLVISDRVIGSWSISKGKQFDARVSILLIIKSSHHSVESMTLRIKWYSRVTLALFFTIPLVLKPAVIGSWSWFRSSFSNVQRQKMWMNNFMRSGVLVLAFIEQTSC